MEGECIGRGCQGWSSLQVQFLFAGERRLSFGVPGQLPDGAAPNALGIADYRLLETAPHMPGRWSRFTCCVMLKSMGNGNSWLPGQMQPNALMQPGGLMLSIDTCGPSGSVALGRLAGRDMEILGETELAGRTFSATLISAIGELLAGNGVTLKDLGGIIAVSGPGSFTGVRVGLSAVKGLAEGARLPVVAISRLLVLARKAGVPSAALDAHRDEVFLRVEETSQSPRELLAGAHELAAIEPAPLRVAVCDDRAADLLAAAWPATQLVRSAAPLASDALRLGESRLIAGLFEDLALLDGNYLRRSDAEIFGGAAAAGQKR
jgi:tRNA threonylcarbamoyladenosine biosynthesis protein TsaB